MSFVLDEPKQNEVEIKNLKSASGKEYGVNTLIPGEYQYMDRSYQFNYIPEEIVGSIHIKTCGDDKLISEKDICVSFEVNCDVEVYILFGDKFPLIPEWLNQFERIRLNITRQDSRIDNLKGYFSLYRKTFSKGTITLYGCSPVKMLEKEWFVKSMGANYCMYTIAIKRKE
jgi:hypothetical protein